MSLLNNLLCLPTAIILLFCVTPLVAADAQWPHNIPRHLKYFPEEEHLVRRAIGVQERILKEKPVGVKKMSLDEGEMFMLDNWIFASDWEKRSDFEDLDYATWQAESPLRLVTEEDFLSRIYVRDILLGRQFKCPDGTSNCSAIGAPDVCCGSGTTCINVNSNSDAGSVGCCPQGQTCAGPVRCDTAHGYSSCPGSSNGGCCLPGFLCQGVGCVFQGTSITFVQPSSSSSSSSTPARQSSPAVIVVPTTPQISPTPTPTSAYTCSSGWFSCPASLGGGCCQNGRSCATGASCPGNDPVSSQAPQAPVRPTSASVSVNAVPTDDSCPTGFYVCSAYYPSGCCRIGRDCKTSGTCGFPGETLLSTNGVVIVAPSGASVATTAAPQRGSCPSSWYSCAADRGGNCCPNGYECGEQCTATASGQSGISQKVAPSTAPLMSKYCPLLLLTVALVSGIGMVTL